MTLILNRRSVPHLLTPQVQALLVTNVLPAAGVGKPLLEVLLILGYGLLCAAPAWWDVRFSNKPWKTLVRREVTVGYSIAPSTQIVRFLRHYAGQALMLLVLKLKPSTVLVQARAPLVTRISGGKYGGRVNCFELRSRGAEAILT